jgi:hypothetical protein
MMAPRWKGLVMKKFVIPLLALVLVAVAVPPASAAWGRGSSGPGGWGERHETHRGGGCVGCGFLGGLILGGILGGVLAAPYYGPPPVYAVPPPPTCYIQPGYWSLVPVAGPGGYVTYQNVWVPPQTVCR